MKFNVNVLFILLKIDSIFGLNQAYSVKLKLNLLLVILQVNLLFNIKKTYFIELKINSSNIFQFF